MFKNNRHIKLILVVIHITLGLVLENDILARIYGHGLFLFALLSIIIRKNKNEEVLLWSLYMVGMEVLMRMTSGLLFSEFTKYALIIFILIGLLVEQKKHHISRTYLLYILLLLIGIAFVPWYDFEKIRQEVAFNLSGPFLLGLASIYFYKRKIVYTTLINGLSYAVYPLITMVSYLFYKTPSISEIVFKSAANFETSAGFGPNQVATIIGFGFFIISLLLLVKNRLSGILVLDILLLIYILFRGLLTFSRGGMVAGVIALTIFLFYHILGSKKKTYNILKYSAIVFLLATSLFFYTNSATSGVLSNRYLNKSTYGIVKKDITSGRIGYFSLELEAFYQNPIFGVGVGGSKNYREKHTKRFIGSSHNELSRLLSEHGIIGVFLILILIFRPLLYFKRKSNIEKSFLLSFYAFWLLTINHSAIRLAFPAFIYGMSLININFNEKNTLYRKQFN